MPTIGIVAGEASGDMLAAELIKAVKQQRPDIEFIGIAGPKMQAAGAKSLFAMEELSVRGYVEVIRHLPKILSIRQQLVKYFSQNTPDLFIGVDAPDFNFGLEQTLKKSGIRTMHYISPSIWAWRGERIHKIKNAVHHMLAVFPFEKPIYDREQIPCTYVGHPLADMLPLETSRKQAKEKLRLNTQRHYIAMLPGSRLSEVQQHARLLVKTATQLYSQYPEFEYLVPLATRATRTLFQQAIVQENAAHLPIKILYGHAHLAMEAADFVLVASGTATLEAALLKRPMAIFYRTNAISAAIMKRMGYLPYVGLPNILAQRFVVPEFLQQAATPENLANAVLETLGNSEKIKEIEQTFTEMHQQLKQNSAQMAAQAILRQLET